MYSQYEQDIINQLYKNMWQAQFSLKNKLKNRNKKWLHILRSLTVQKFIPMGKTKLSSAPTEILSLGGQVLEF